MAIACLKGRISEQILGNVDPNISIGVNITIYINLRADYNFTEINIVILNNGH